MSVLLINGEEQSLALDRGTSAVQIIENHLAGRIPDNQVVCEAQIDDGNTELARARWGEFDTMNVRTGSPLSLVSQGLNSSSELMHEMSDGLAQAVEHLRAGESEAFRPVFVGIIDNLLIFLRFLSMAQAYMGDKEAVIEHFQRSMKELVEQIAKAQESSDAVLIADLLEYELAPLFEAWDGVRQVLDQTLAKRDQDV